MTIRERYAEILQQVYVTPEEWGLIKRRQGSTIRKWCQKGRQPGAFFDHGRWLIDLQTALRADPPRQPRPS